MKQRLLNALKFDAALLPFALIAGISIGFYEWTTGIAAVLEGITKSQFILIVLIQTVIYAMFTGFAGHLLAGQTGLLRPFTIQKKPLIRTVSTGILAGAAFFLLESIVFCALIPEVAVFYENKSFSAVYLVSEIFYGGVIEEVLLRLFFMTLLAFLIWKIFARKYAKEEIPAAVFIAANIIAAMTFAAGHLPATYTMYGKFSALILIRCFLINGGLGLIFGRLYRKYGIQYAMIAHGLIHVVNDSLFLIASGF
ncbi:MAG: type II CAAX prenyl endopeptidase Rce1 family protein [Clostridia bacterium]